MSSVGIGNKGSVNPLSQRSLETVGEEGGLCAKTGDSGETFQGSGNFVEGGVPNGTAFTSGVENSKSIEARVVEEVVPNLEDEQVNSQDRNESYGEKISGILKDAKDGIKKAGEDFKKNLKETKNYEDLARNYNALKEDLKGIRSYIKGVSTVISDVYKEKSTVSLEVKKDIRKKVVAYASKNVSPLQVEARVFNERFTEDSFLFRGVVNTLLEKADEHIREVGKKIDKLDKELSGDINKLDKKSIRKAISEIFQEISDKVNTSLKEASSRVKEEVGKSRGSSVSSNTEGYFPSSKGNERDWN